MKKTVFLTICLVALAATTGKCQTGEVGSTAPDFSGKTIEKKEFSLSKSQQAGEIVVLNFWFAGCGPCLMEIKFLRKLVEENKGKKIRFIALSIDEPTSPKVIKDFVEAKRFTYEHISHAKEIAKKYGVENFPTNIVIKDGKVVWRKIGYHDDINLEIAQYLKP
ncbi:MAG: TlpA family protein disulfide reductase [Raineya sp.]|jgi:thiol-disulfide isomerase/thioredoxin|nr:TlpA family protein disulfide reductase [Raineya sp.]